MSILKKLFSGTTAPRQRVHICVECGMPVGDHKGWCSILCTRQEYAAKRAAAGQSAQGAGPLPELE